MLQRDLDRGVFDAIIINFYNPPKPSLYPKVFQVSLGVAQLIPKQNF